ncbi:conserved Plasmodium protein, unknown function [Plasmodium relictum]|uniref:Uncharacterized protein n=1 Tax=Plasmodium relictum TaxID=85471 RepID=A0A1J1H2Y3_PLARL|nr:conserved Plasmodium protein, unknown function [Plasmodium relictum]CRG99292.1 conserved Plasmodium protein, unknown function [Plasmodium relictum]
MDKANENVINCRRLHRANMIFATISNDYNYICIITFYENNYNLELFSTNNQMQKIFRKTILDEINKVYINYNNKYICATSKSGSMYILDMKGNIIHKNETMHSLYKPKKIRNKNEFQNFIKRKKKEAISSNTRDQILFEEKDKMINQNINKIFKVDKILKKQNTILTYFNSNNKIHKDKSKYELNSMKYTLSSTFNFRKINKKKKAFNKIGIVKKIDKNNYKNNYKKKKNVHESITTKNNNKTKIVEVIDKKNLETLLSSSKNNYFNSNIDNNINKENNINENCKNSKGNNKNMEFSANDELNSSCSSLSEFSFENNLNDFFMMQDLEKKGKRKKNYNIEYEKFCLEIVDIYWISIEKESKNKFIESTNCFYDYNFYDNLHIIYSLDVAFNILCSINLKIIIYKYNILEHFYKNINSYKELKNNIIYCFKENFLKKCKRKSHYLQFYKLSKCYYKNKTYKLNTSINRYKNKMDQIFLHKQNKTNDLSYFHLNIRDDIIKRIFNDIIIDIKQSYVSNDQHYILINYYINIKEKYISFSSLDFKTNEKRNEKKKKKKKFDLIRIYKNRKKMDNFQSSKCKLCFLGIQKISCIDKECKSVEKIMLYLLYSYNIIQNIYNLYEKMSSIYTKFDDYKKLYKIYENILQLDDNFKKFYYKDREIIYFSKYVKNRKENFDENLYNLFFKENEKHDFAHYYDIMRKMIEDKIVCCSCSKNKFFNENLQNNKIEKFESEIYQIDSYLGCKEKIDISNNQKINNNFNKNITASPPTSKKENDIKEEKNNIITKNNSKVSKRKLINIKRDEVQQNELKKSIKMNSTEKLNCKKLNNLCIKKHNNYTNNTFDCDIIKINGKKKYVNNKNKTCMPFYNLKNVKSYNSNEKKEIHNDNNIKITFKNGNSSNEMKMNNDIIDKKTKEKKITKVFIKDENKNNDKTENSLNTYLEKNIQLSENASEENFLKSRIFIIKNGENICDSCKDLLKKDMLNSFENFELNYEIPKKNIKLSNEEIYNSLIKDIYIMYKEKKCPINILLLLQELSDKELESCMTNFQLILQFYEKTFLQNVNDNLNNLFNIVNICKTLSNNVNIILKKYCNDQISKLHDDIIYCLEKFQSFFQLHKHLNIFLFFMELLLFISKNIYFESFPHYKETFSNYKNIEILKNYHFIKGYKINFNHFDEYLHNNYIKAHKFYLSLNKIRIKLIQIFKSFAYNKNLSSLYNISILNIPINKFNYFTLPKNSKKNNSVQNFSYFDDFVFKNNSKIYPFYICTCDKYSFINITKYYQSEHNFVLIQRKSLKINLYPLDVLNIIAISKSFFYIFTKKDKKLNITSLKVKYGYSKKKHRNNILKYKNNLSNLNNLCVLKCSNLESYFPNPNSFKLKIQILYNSIIANCEPDMCIILHTHSYKEQKGYNK